jgi:hypothetical protein
MSFFPKINALLDKYFIKDISNLICLYGIGFLYEKEHLIISDSSLMIQGVDISEIFYHRVLYAYDKITLHLQDKLTFSYHSFLFEFSEGTNIIKNLSEENLKFISDVCSYEEFSDEREVREIYLKTDQTSHDIPSSADFSFYSPTFMLVTSHSFKKGISTGLAGKSNTEETIPYGKIFKDIFNICKKIGKFTMTMTIKYGNNVNYEDLSSFIGKNLVYSFPFMTFNMVNNAISLTCSYGGLPEKEVANLYF